MNPMKALLRSRKFLLLVLDVVISLITYFVTKYAVPTMADDVLLVIGTIQPIFVAIVVAISVEDAAAKRSGTFRYR